MTFLPLLEHLPLLLLLPSLGAGRMHVKRRTKQVLQGCIEQFLNMKEVGSLRHSVWHGCEDGARTVTKGPTRDRLPLCLALLQNPELKLGMLCASVQDEVLTGRVQDPEVEWT